MNVINVRLIKPVNCPEWFLTIANITLSDDEDSFIIRDIVLTKGIGDEYALKYPKHKCREERKPAKNFYSVCFPSGKSFHYKILNAIVATYEVEQKKPKLIKAVI